MLNRTLCYRLGGALLLALLAGSAGCAPLSAGRKYTVAKIDRDGRTLVQARRVVEEGFAKDEYDTVIRDGEYLTIVLNEGFVRFLQSAGRPEVLIFVRVRVRPRNSAEETMVWDRILLHTEEENQQMVLNQDSFLPRMDIPLMPPVKYEGQDVLVSLRIVELDQDDNRRLNALLSTAAAGAATFQPEAAAAISAFQAVLSFLIANNYDDIEFQLDFALSESDGPIEHTYRVVDRGAPRKCTERYDTVLTTRAASYVVIKTEHRDRADIPSNYFALGHHAVRYIIAQALKIGTLGIANWPIWTAYNADRQDDFYLRVLGRPFSIEQPAWTIPEWEDGSLTHRRRFEKPTPRRLGYPIEQRYRFALENKRLVLIEKEQYEAEYDTLRHSPSELFRDQAYLVFSVEKRQAGVDLSALIAARKGKDTIDRLVRTSQLTPAEFQEQLDRVGGAIASYVRSEELRDVIRPRLEQTTDPADVERLWETAEGQLASRVADLPTVEQQKIYDTVFRDFARRMKRLGGSPGDLPRRLSFTEEDFELVAPPFLSTTSVEHEIGIRHRADLKPEVSLAVTGATNNPQPLDAVGRHVLEEGILSTFRITIDPVSLSPDVPTEYELFVRDEEHDLQEKFTIWIGPPPSLVDFRAEDGRDLLKEDWQVDEEATLRLSNLHGKRGSESVDFVETVIVVDEAEIEYPLKVDQEKDVVKLANPRGAPMEVKRVEVRVKPPAMTPEPLERAQ